MTSFQATLVNAGYGQLALRDQNGQIAQKWTLGGPKCVIGAHANCNVRCMLPGIADHHLLLVIGSRQIYLRALAAGVEREGSTVNELILSGDHAQVAFQLAGHRFEYSRQNHPAPIAKPFLEEQLPQAKPEHGQEAFEKSKRLRFTFVQALEKNRERSEASSASDSAVPANAGTSERPTWVEEIVRDALRPIELRLQTIAEPINHLERQLRRQRARFRKQQRQRKLSRHTAHEAGPSPTQQLVDAQAAVQRIVADQAARLEMVSERVGDILSQLVVLERIVSVENDQQREVASRTSQSGAEIIRLQREMLALINALQTRIAEPATASGEDVQWRASIERQLDELHQSLGILEEIKSSLDLAVSQNRELSEDLQAQRQTIEEVAKRPVIIQSVPMLAPQTLQSPIVGPAAQPSSGNDQPIEFTRGALPRTADERAMLEAPDLGSPSIAGDVRVAPVSTSPDPVPLPSWWAEDPVADEPAAEEAADRSPATSSATNVFSDDLSYDGEPGHAPQASLGFANDAALGDSALDRPLLDVSALDVSGRHDYAATASLPGYPAAAGRAPSDYEQEINPREVEVPWSYAPPSYDAAQSDLSARDGSQPLVSASPEPPAPVELEPGAHGEQTFGEQAFATQTLPEQTFEEHIYTKPGYAEPSDVRDASDAVNRSASVIEDQLHTWLSDGYQTADADQSLAASGLDALEGDEAAQASPSADVNLFTRHLRQPHSPAFEQAVEEPQPSEDGYEVSAFSAERLSIEHMRSEAPPEYAGSAAADEMADEAPYRGAERIDESQAPASQRDTSQRPAADGADESVEEYMRRLLARMRGVSESEVKLPGLDRAESPWPDGQPRAPLSDTVVTAASSSHDTHPASGAWTQPFDPTNYVPRVAPPEDNSNIDAMRELANTSARSAIHVSARRKHGAAILIKSAVALVGLMAGAALVSINGFRVNIGLIATLASFMVAFIWGYDALATLRPLLQASRAAKSHTSKPVVRESSEEAS